MPLLFLLRGYGVLYADMPIVGGNTANDTFVEQLVADARAAVSALANAPLVDTARIGLFGHSYGGMTVATLLERTDLFAAGVALSGAYNFTLDPFGFQTETRSLWEAQQVYLRMSPIFYADRIHKPLLLMHGAADENGQALPEESRKMFQAISGLGGTARLVMLPLERHVYQARETVDTVMCEGAWVVRPLRKKRQQRQPAQPRYTLTCRGLHFMPARAKPAEPLVNRARCYVLCAMSYVQ